MTARRVLRLTALSALPAMTLSTAGCVPAAVMGGGALLGGAVVTTTGNDGRPGSAVGAAVTVTLDPARDVALVSAARRDTTWLRGTTFLVGRVTASRADTLWVRVTEARSSAGLATFPASGGPTALIASSGDVAVRVINKRPRETTDAFLGITLGTAAVVFGFLWYVGHAYGNT